MGNGAFLLSQTLQLIGKNNIDSKNVIKSETENAGAINLGDIV